MSGSSKFVADQNSLGFEAVEEIRSAVVPAPVLAQGSQREAERCEGACHTFIGEQNHGCLRSLGSASKAKPCGRAEPSTACGSAEVDHHRTEATCLEQQLGTTKRVTYRGGDQFRLLPRRGARRHRQGR